MPRTILRASPPVTGKRLDAVRAKRRAAPIAVPFLPAETPPVEVRHCTIAAKEFVWRVSVTISRYGSCHRIFKFCCRPQG